MPASLGGDRGVVGLDGEDASVDHSWSCPGGPADSGDIRPGRWETILRTVWDIHLNAYTLTDRTIHGVVVRIRTPIVSRIRELVAPRASIGIGNIVMA